MKSLLNYIFRVLWVLPPPPPIWCYKLRPQAEEFWGDGTYEQTAWDDADNKILELQEESAGLAKSMHAHEDFF